MQKRTLIERIMPDSAGTVESIVALKERYKQFFRSLTIVLLVLVLVPMMIISLLSYSQYKRLLAEEEVRSLLLNAEQAESSIARFIVKLKAVIDFAGHGDRYNDLLKQEALARLFHRLQKSYPDFTDIEVIGPEGKTVAYQGDYVQKPRDYTQESWYQQTIKHGFYISSLFEGFRGVSHFVIAIARKMPGQEQCWVMRVNIDGNTLQRYVESTGVVAADDIFLIDQQGIVQTVPRRYGERGKTSPYQEDIESHSVREVRGARESINIITTAVYQIPDEKRGNMRVLQAVVPVRGSPWKLVMIKEFYTYSNRWKGFRNRLLCYCLCCGGIAVAVILHISKSITSHLQESESERRQFLLEAEHSDKLASIGRLAAGVAHEINNPLAIINQKAGLMKDYMEMAGNFNYKEDFTKVLDGIDQSVGRCKTITHRLLGFARHTDIKEEDIVINDLLKEVSAFVEREAAYSQIGIVFFFAEVLPKIYSDKGQLQQVFLNILNNAIDAINGGNKKDKRGGTITIITEMLQEEGYVKVVIKDNGSGMSEETLKHLFDPFYTTKKAGEGTGLGLSISYGIIEKLGGKIDVFSQLGKGSEFSFLLPFSK